jgi:hypothetical protein
MTPSRGTDLQDPLRAFQTLASSITLKIIPKMSSLLFENIKIFDGRDIIPSGFVLVSGGVISHVDSQPPVSIPSNTQRVPGADRTLLPGLIDSHVHAHLHPGKGSDEIKAPMKLGVTTILDMHNEPDDVNRLKKDCRESNELPDLKSSYHGATIDGGWPKPIVLTLDTSEEVGFCSCIWLQSQSSILRQFHFFHRTSSHREIACSTCNFQFPFFSSTD